MPLFGNKKKKQKQESSLAGESSSNNVVTEAKSAKTLPGNGLSQVTSSRVIQSSTLHATTITEIRREERFVELPGLSRFKATQSSLHETRSDGNFGLNCDLHTSRPVQYRSAFSGNTFGSYPSRSSTSPVAASLIEPISLISGGDGVRRSAPNVPRLSVPTIRTFANNNNINVQPHSAPISSAPSVVPVYTHNALKRGRVLMINNIKFLSKDNEERRGAQKDHTDMKKFFRELNFDVKDYTNLTCKQMNEKIKAFSKSSFKEYNMSIVVMMSHGTNRDAKGNAIKGGYTEIFGVDDSGLTVDEVLSYFSTDQCKQLTGKPKIFIFQCCRGNLDETIAYDARPFRPDFKMHEDMLLAFSTLPGFLSNRDPVNGTWYIQSIVETFRKHYQNLSIEDMLKIVDQTMSNKHPVYKQTSTYENRGFKTCYLVPRNNN